MPGCSISLPVSAQRMVELACIVSEEYWLRRPVESLVLLAKHGRTVAESFSLASDHQKVICRERSRPCASFSYRDFLIPVILVGVDVEQDLVFVSQLFRPSSLELVLDGS